MNHKTVPENSRINSFHQAVVILRHEVRHRRIAGDEICCQHIRNIHDIALQCCGRSLIHNALVDKGHYFVLLLQVRNQRIDVQ